MRSAVFRVSDDRTSMRRRRWIREIGLPAIVAVLAACSPGAEAASAAESIKVRACQCADNACATAVANELAKLAEDLDDAPLSLRMPAARQMRRANPRFVCSVLASTLPKTPMLPSAIESSDLSHSRMRMYPRACHLALLSQRC